MKRSRRTALDEARGQQTRRVRGRVDVITESKKNSSSTRAAHRIYRYSFVHSYILLLYNVIRTTHNTMRCVRNTAFGLIRLLPDIGFHLTLYHPLPVRVCEKFSGRRLLFWQRAPLHITNVLYTSCTRGCCTLGR